MIFKTKKVELRFKEVHPIQIEICKEMDKWLLNYDGSQLEITDAKTTLKEDEALNRVSSSHREGRAIDISVNGWDKQKVSDFCLYFSNKYHLMGAVSLSDNIRRFIVWRKHGSGAHIHTQLGHDVIIKYKDKYPLYKG
jgi:hypothetical protein